MLHILGFILRRLLISLPALFLLIVGIFILLQFAPGDTVDALLAQMGGGDSQMRAMLRKYYGLDKSVSEQLILYMWHVIHFDFGESAIYGKPVFDVIFERLPATLLLMLTALALAFFLGLVLGVFSAVKVHQWQDSLISGLGVLIYATPTFWFGLMSIVLFSVYLQWLPSGGFGEVGSSSTGWQLLIERIPYLVLPTMTLALSFLALYLRMMRASMLEVLHQDFVRTARAKGLSESGVIYGHVLRNAFLPMITMVGLQASSLLGGSIVVESIFFLPGLGRLALESVVQRDLNMLLAIVFCSGLLVICMNVIVDLLYVICDPRVGLKK